MIKICPFIHGEFTLPQVDPDFLHSEQCLIQYPFIQHSDFPYVYGFTIKFARFLVFILDKIAHIPISLFDIWSTKSHISLFRLLIKNRIASFLYSYAMN